MPSKAIRYSLGDRVNTLGNHEEKSSLTATVSQTKRLSIVVLTLFGWLAIVNLGAYSILELIIFKRHPDLNTKKPFESFENPYWDTVHDTIPFMQDWYKTLNVEETEKRNPLLQRDETTEKMCIRAFYSSEIDIEATEKYNDFFNEESVMILAQAGVYKGPDDIAEYMKFALNDSPYIDKRQKLRSDLVFKTYDNENNACEFALFNHAQNTMNRDTTRYPAAYNHTLMMNIRLDISDEPVISQIYVYYSEAFLDLYFGSLLNSDNTRDFVCDVMKCVCGQAVENCQEKLADLAIAEGERRWFDGNSQGCRALHAVFAEKNPVYCAHIFFEPTPDANGNIKCQESARVTPESLFSDADFEAFKNFQLSVGIDPKLGYDESCEEGNFCDELFDRPTGQLSLSPSATPIFDLEPKGCVERLISTLQENFYTTSPDHVELILQNIGLDDKFVVRDALEELLSQPQPLDTMYNDSSTCLGSNVAVVELACIMEESGQWSSPTQKDLHVLEYLVNQAAVFESLTLASLDDIELLHTIVEVLTNDQRIFREDAIKDNDVVSEDTKEAFVETYRSAVSILNALAKSIAENSNAAMMPALQLSILTGTKTDIENDLESNARVGVALAADVKFNPFVKDNVMKWKKSSSWAESYLAWSIANVWGSLPADYLGPLVMPSISCSASGIDGESFVARRLVSQSLAIIHQFQGPLSEAAAALDREVLEDIGDYSKDQAESDLTLIRYNLADAFGTSNMKKVKVDSPSKESVWKMLYTLCGERCHDGYWGVPDTAPSSKMDHEQFLVYEGFIIFMTVVITGIGSELLMFVFYLQKYGWTKENQKQWKLAQFVFSLMSVTTLGLAANQNFMALLFCVMFLWKFGFPETILYQYMALFNTEHNFLERICDFLNATGTMAHHGAATMVISMLLVGVITGDRYVLAPCLILSVQHWLVLLKYVNNNVYIGITLMVEVFFEWVTINVLEHNASNHWTAALTSVVMLFAHWQYLLAGALGLITEYLTSDKRDEGVEMKVVRQSIISGLDMKTSRQSVMESMFEIESLV